MPKNISAQRMLEILLEVNLERDPVDYTPEELELRDRFEVQKREANARGVELWPESSDMDL